MYYQITNDSGRTMNLSFYWEEGKSIPAARLLDGMRVSSVQFEVGKPLVVNTGRWAWDFGQVLQVEVLPGEPPIGPKFEGIASPVRDGRCLQPVVIHYHQDEFPPLDDFQMG